MMTTKNNGPLLKNYTYDRVRSFVELGLPGLGAFYFALSQIWGLPYGEEVVGTLAALTTLLGIFVVISRKQYNEDGPAFDGTMRVLEDDAERSLYSLDVDTPLEKLPKQKEIRLRVAPQKEAPDLDS